jgi:hypothetical protein
MLAAVVTLFSLISAAAVIGAPSSISGDIEVLPEWQVFIEGRNDTLVNIDGQFRVEEKSGLDTLLDLTATLSVSGGDWQAQLPKTTFPNVVTGEIYLFKVVITVPFDVTDGAVQTFSVKLTLTNQLNTAQDQVSFTVAVQREEDPDDDDGPLSLPGGSSIPLLPIFFVAAILVFAAVAGIWVSKNIEIVREVGGRRRIFFREKGSGRILGKRRPPPVG